MVSSTVEAPEVPVVVELTLSRTGVFTPKHPELTLATGDRHCLVGATWRRPSWSLQQCPLIPGDVVQEQLVVNKRLWNIDLLVQSQVMKALTSNTLYGKINQNCYLKHLVYNESTFRQYIRLATSDLFDSIPLSVIVRTSGAVLSVWFSLCCFVTNCHIYR